jgi:hypothetical protein
MITSLLILGLFLFLLIIIFTIVIIKIQYNKVKVYENWILEFKGDVELTLENLRSIDKRGTFATSMNEKGTFESDDEVGIIFKEMETIVEKLNQRTQ